MKRLAIQIHLIVGILSGPVVFILAITGAILAYEHEIADLTQPYRFNPIPLESKPTILPSQIIAASHAALPTPIPARSIIYSGPKRAVKVVHWGSGGFYTNFVDPSTTEVRKVQATQRKEPLGWIRGLHTHFLLKGRLGELGHFVKVAATLSVLVLTLSGLIRWWPRNLKRFKASLKPKRFGNWLKTQRHLHVALGLYALLFTTIMAASGLYFGSEWVRNSTKWTLTAGDVDSIKKRPVLSGPVNDSKVILDSIDYLWSYIPEVVFQEQTIEFRLPRGSKQPIQIGINPSKLTIHRQSFQHIDPRTREVVRIDTPETSNFATRITSSLYDIHTGSYFGRLSQFIWCAACLFLASLPISGTYIALQRLSRKKPVS